MGTYVHHQTRANLNKLGRIGGLGGGGKSE
jgi:hypothetical protein